MATPTRAQLEAEVWWGREVSTPELYWLEAELCARSRRKVTHAGGKGDIRHLNGGHRSLEWILKSRWCTNRTYTVQSGLSGEMLRWIGAFDWIPGEWGTAANRRAVADATKRLIAAMKRGELPGLLQVLGTVDGKTTGGYDNRTGDTLHPDSSHLDHIHLTFDRRKMRDLAMMVKIADLISGDEMHPDDADALIWRVEGLTAGREAVAGGKKKGEPIVANIRARELAERVAALEIGGIDLDALAVKITARLEPGVELTKEDVRTALRAELGATRFTPSEPDATTF